MFFIVLSAPEFQQRSEGNILPYSHRVTIQNTSGHPKLLFFAWIPQANVSGLIWGYVLIFMQDLKLEQQLGSYGISTNSF